MTNLTLKSFLTESKADLSSLRAIRKYSDRLSGRKKEKFEGAIDRILEGYASDNLYKSEYGDHYSYGIVRGLEAIYEKIIDDEQVRAALAPVDEVDRNAYWDLVSIFSVQSIPKMVRIANKYRKFVPQAMQEFLDDAAGLKDDIKEVKKILKSGRKPKESPANPNAFVRPMASLQAKREVSRIVKEAISGFEKELETNTVARYVSAYRALEAITTKEELKIAAKNMQELAYLYSRGFAKIRNNVVEMSGYGSEEKAADMARAQVRNVIEGFEGKNILKLAAIFQKKSGLKSYTLHRANISNNLVSNSMSFIFDDNSKFTVYSQVEVAYTSSGRPFLRYPTRFTEVYLSDGTKMASPSEEKMVKEF